VGAFEDYDGGPFTAGVQTLTHTITLSQDGSGFTNDATVQFADFSGNPVFPPTGLCVCCRDARPVRKWGD
jgi:hypothetical protein